MYPPYLGRGGSWVYRNLMRFFFGGGGDEWGGAAFVSYKAIQIVYVYLVFGGHRPRCAFVAFLTLGAYVFIVHMLCFQCFLVVTCFLNKLMMRTTTMMIISGLSALPPNHSRD